MEGDEQPVVSSAPMGRGRGRGRGGVPVLPTGVWSSLNGDTPAQPLPADVKQGQFDDPDSTSHTNDPPPTTTDEPTDPHHRHDARPRGPSFDLPVHHQPRRQRKDFNLDQPYQQSEEDHHHSTATANHHRKSFDKDAKGKDWTCICGNLNWSWRSHCNTCQNAKPANLLTGNEVRDGAGSGFFERQERASMVTGVEVDVDGFDDFGRRVKKATKASSDVAVEMPSARSTSVSGNDPPASAAAVPETKEQAALRRLQEKYQFLLPTADGLPPATLSREASAAPPSTAAGTTTASSRRSRSRSRSPPRSNAHSAGGRDHQQNDRRRGDHNNSRDRPRTHNQNRQESSSFKRRDHSRERPRDGGERDHRRYPPRDDEDSRQRRDDHNRDRDRDRDRYYRR